MNPRIKRLLSMILVLTVLFSLCTPVYAAGNAETVTEIAVGECVQLRAAGWFAHATWTSSDPSVAAVSSRGMVTGIAPGTVTVTAESRWMWPGSRKTTAFTVTVTEKDTLTLEAGESVQLTVESRGCLVSWSSSDENVVSVDRDGLITGIDTGTATITATARKLTSLRWMFWWDNDSLTETTTVFYVTVLRAPVEPTEPAVTEPEMTEPEETVPETTVPEETVPETTIPEETAPVETEPEETEPEETEPEETEPEITVPVTFTVTFQTSGGSEILPQTVEAGACAVRPDDPTLEGCTFAGWYTDAGLTDLYDFSAPVTSDMTLYAKWEPIPVYTVTFVANGGSEVAAQQVQKGMTVQEPEAPVLEGQTFAGWYTDAELTLAYDFSAPVTTDLTLYARWRAEDNLEDDVLDLGDIENKVAEGELEVIYGEDGELRTIDGSFTDEIVTSPQEAADVLNLSETLFGETFSAEAEQITAQSTGSGEESEHFYRYSPTVNGVAVLGSQIILATDENGNVTGMFSSFDEGIYSVDTAPAITAEEAVRIALNNVMTNEQVTSFLESLPEYAENSESITAAFRDALSAEAKLVIYAADADQEPVLVYAVTVRLESSGEADPEETGEEAAVETEAAEETTAENDEEPAEDEEAAVPAAPVVNLTVYVYASGEHGGEIFRSIENTVSWTAVTLEGEDALGETRIINGQENEDGTFRLKDTTRNLTTYKATSTGMLWWKEYQIPGQIASTSTFFGERISKMAVSAHANMSDTYDFYYNVLGLDSFDGEGAQIRVTYDYGDNYENAYWTPDNQQFVFGSGDDYAAALDVVAHEFTHAVINYEVGNGHDITLTYWGETGALNEAYADIMGALVEGKTGEDFWTIGEDMGAVMRSLKDPTAYGQPDHYSALSDATWLQSLNNYQNRDYEGVHIFNSVYTHAVYLMMSDSRCEGISQTTWAKVFYRSLNRLTSDATFLDGRGAVLSAAKNLGFNHDQQQAIKDAFDAVGICEPDAIRIILQWGETPADLDSHLVGPGVTADERFHVYFGNRSYYADGTYDSETAQCAVDLDYDDVTSFGPEVTTVHVLTPGEYYFYIHDFTNGYSETSTQMALSGAKVTVYRGSSNTPIAEFQIDPTSCGTHWNVFRLTIAEDKSVDIQEINTYSKTAVYS